MRSVPTPAVRIVLLNESDKVLVLRRALDRFLGGSWCLPGGKIDYGETVEECLFKELFEETGLQITASKFLFYQNNLPTEENDFHYITLYFNCRAEGKIVLNSESMDYAWMSINELTDYKLAFGNDEAILRFWHSKKSL